uniref:Uncharacterized protein n=1 Tax=Acrobeloides nanus TaxID=290746 RepID=A0A914CHY7_9BILA
MATMATMACADFQPTGFPYTVVPSSVPMTTSAMGACAPNVYNSYREQHECRSGSCDLYYSDVADSPCACDTCLDPSQYCTQAACNGTCGAAGFECDRGDCDQGICDCFICDCE